MHGTDEEYSIKKSSNSLETNSKNPKERQMETILKMKNWGIKTMRIKKLKLVLIGVIVAYISVYIFDYPTIYLFAFNLGLDTYDIIGWVSTLIG